MEESQSLQGFPPFPGVCIQSINEVQPQQLMVVLRLLLLFVSPPGVTGRKGSSAITWFLVSKTCRPFGRGCAGSVCFGLRQKLVKGKSLGILSRLLYLVQL